MEDETPRCLVCGAALTAEEEACPSCGAIPLGVPAVVATEPWYRNPMVRLAFVTVAAIVVAVVVILMNPG
jgi:hypothetical protein